MGLFDMFKKKESVSASVAEPAPVTEKPQQPEWLCREVLMEGIPQGLSEEAMENLEDKTSDVFDYNDDQPEKAFEEFRRLGRKGCGEAMYWTAECYENGDGTEVNRKEYLRWIWRAAYTGHRSAMYSVGCELEQGKAPLSKDIVEAFRWYMRAAKAGSETAKEDVETMLDYIKNDMFYDIYGGNAQQALEITEIYLDSFT